MASESELLSDERCVNDVVIQESGAYIRVDKKCFFLTTHNGDVSSIDCIDFATLECMSDTTCRHVVMHNITMGEVRDHLKAFNLPR